MDKSLLQRWFGRFASASDSPSTETAPLLQKAQALLASEDYDSAAATYREATAAAPRHAAAHLGLGVALYESGKYGEAASALERALALDRSQTDAHRFLAAIYRNMGKASEAESQYRRIVSAMPEDEPNYLNLCTLLVEQHRLNDARDVVSQALARLPGSANLHFYMGNLQQELGHADLALASWRASLAAQPDQVAVLHNMGLSLLSRDELAEAAELFRRAADLAPDWAEGQSNLGQVELRRGKPDAAIGHFEKAVALDPASARGHFNLGEALFAKGELASALDNFGKAQAIDPDLPAAHLRMAAVFLALGRHGEAEGACREALDIAPDNVEALMRLGRLLLAKGEYENALVNFRQVTLQDPSHVDALFSIGEALLIQAQRGNPAERKTRLDEAAAAFGATLAADPSIVNAYINLGAIHIERDEYEAARAIYRKILSLDPRSAMAHHNLGAIEEARARHVPLAQRLEMYDAAIAQYRAAFALDGSQAASLINIGRICEEQLRYDEATDLYRQALAIAPDSLPARMYLGMLQLAAGDFTDGWRNFEARWGAIPGLTRLTSAQPHWDGSVELQGRTILLYTEQGLGDNLQFIRYASLLAARGASVWVLAPAPLTQLFASCPGVQRVFGEDDTIPPPDFVCPLLSVPAALKTELASIPAAVPYLQANAERLAHWREKLGPKSRLRVGLVWAGNPQKETRESAAISRMRCLHFDQIRPLLEVPDVDFFSLQVGRESAAQLDRNSSVIDFTQQLTDFQETAAFVAQLDLAICVDTSTAHLVGAIGKPVWLLNRFNTCWRWMLERPDSPWYPTMRIFRQPQLGAWDPVIAEVKAALSAAARAHERRD